MSFGKKITLWTVAVILLFCLYQTVAHFLAEAPRQDLTALAVDPLARPEHSDPSLDSGEVDFTSENTEVVGPQDLVVTETIELEASSAATVELQEPDEVPSLPFNASNSETMHLDPPLRDIGAAWLNDTGRNDFSMPIPGGRELPIRVERFVAIGEDGGEFIGVVEGYPGSRVELSYRGDGEAGTIRLPTENRMYVMLPGSDGSVVFQERTNTDSRSFSAPTALPSSIPSPPNFIPPPPPQKFGNFDSK